MKLFVVLLAVAGMALASGTLSGRVEGSGGGFIVPPTDDIVDSYVFNNDELYQTIPASFGDYGVVDDFNYPVDDQLFLNTYTCWGVTTGGAPTSLDLLFVMDSSGAPSGDPTVETFSVTTTNTGYTFAGYPIWAAEIDCASNPEVNTPVWLGSHRTDGTNWYVCGGPGIMGSEAYRTEAAGWSWVPFSSTSVGAADIFKIIDATVSLERNTWASIKNMF